MAAKLASAVVAHDAGTQLASGQVTNTSPLTVTVNGTAIPMVCLGSYAPFAGDTVSVIRQDSTWLCLGTQTGGGHRPVQMSASGGFTLTGSDQAIPGTLLTVTTTKPNVWFMASGYYDFTMNAGGFLALGRLYVDGAIQGGEAHANAVTSGRVTPAMGWVGNLAVAGVHTLQLYASCTGGTNLAVGSLHTRAVYLIGET
jgi:hypothetical protein